MCVLLLQNIYVYIYIKTDLKIIEHIPVSKQDQIKIKERFKLSR